MSSSNLLESAIADAKLIRATALKNAQDSVLEQFAPEVKKTLNRLLEAELGLDPELEQPNLNPGLGGSPGGNQGMDPMMGGGLGGPEGEPDLTVNVGDENAGPDSTLKNIPLAATEGQKLCSCPDEDDSIEINFDELEKQMKSVYAKDATGGMNRK